MLELSQLKKITLLVAVNFVSKIPNTMILLYLFFIEIFENSLKINILQNIYATKPIYIELAFQGFGFSA